MLDRNLNVCRGAVQSQLKPQIICYVKYSLPQPCPNLVPAEIEMIFYRLQLLSEKIKLVEIIKILTGWGSKAKRLKSIIREEDRLC